MPPTTCPQSQALGFVFKNKYIIVIKLIYIKVGAVLFQDIKH
jgi:hypothetical protein